ncbi:MAG: TolC family protein [Bacteroidota bacterium]|nr:TolC family protein [Bacteroidota bacterium]
MSYNRFCFCLIFICILSNAMPVRLCAQSKSLDNYITAGLQNSPLLKEINNNILLNHIDSLRILATYQPQVNGVSYNYAAPVVHGFGYDGGISNVYNVSEQVSATQLLVSKRSLRIQFNGIQLLNDSLSIAGKITGQDVKRTITAAYIAAYGSWRQYSFDKEVYDLLSAEDTVLKKLAQASVYRQTDYLTFLVTLQQQHLLITQAKIQYQSDFATLNYVSGLFDTTFVPLDSPRIEITQLPEMNASIFYQKFTVDSLLLQNAGRRIDLSYRPKITLGADAGYVSSFVYTPYKNWGASANVNVIVPIYDGKQRKLSHKRLDILENTRANYRDFFATQYKQQIAQLTQQLNSTKTLIAETANQLKYVRALIVANSKLLATGDVRIADYVIAINNFLNAQNVVIQNTVAQFQIITQINYWNRR